jgi:cytochrome c
MKKFIIALSLSTLVYACGNNQPPTSEKEPAEEVAPAENTVIADSLSKNPVYQKGLELIAKSDCLTCHKIDDISTGPSYREVADKYEANKKQLSLLADKIIKGGSGVWGQVPMTAHPTLSKKYAEQMLAYIFLLKK